MKQKKITYGVSGMMEYQAVIKVGKNNMKVLFSDGSVSAMGVNPATFTTDSFMVQHAIESSTDFKRGLIYVVRSIELNTDLHIERNEPKELEPGSADTEANASVPEQKDDESEHRESAVAPQEVYEEQAEGLIQVEFASNDEAKDYLEQKFGLVRSKLHNRDDIRNAGKTHGVDIIFI